MWVKLIVFTALLGVAFSAAAAADAPTCTVDAGGWDNAGQCQYCHVGCTKCTAAGSDKCTACATGLELASGKCGCATGKYLLFAAQGTPSCGDLGTYAADFCKQPGYGAVANADGVSDKTYCLECAASENGCYCSDKTTKDTAKAECTACHDGTTLANKLCPAPTNNPKLIPGVGFYKACPDGYVDKSGICTPCGPGCKTCDATTVAKCLTCPTGYGLDASNVCKKCATGETVNATTNKCEVALPWGCKKADATTATKCDKDSCDATKNFVFQESDGMCVCNKQTWKKKTSADGVTPEVHECAACTKTCTAPNECKTDGSDCEVKTVTVACDNAALKDSGCNTCAKDATDATLFVCSACATGTKLGDATKDKTKACVCSGGATKEAWDKTNKKCVACDKECTGTTPSCNLGTDGKATCGATPPPPTTGTDDTTNSILISAISMLLAVILF